jgi:hypothetical protein
MFISQAFDRQTLKASRRFDQWQAHPNLVCCSDSLMREIDNAGLRLPPHHRLKEF